MTGWRALVSRPNGWTWLGDTDGRRPLIGDEGERVCFSFEYSENHSCKQMEIKKITVSIPWSQLFPHRTENMNRREFKQSLGMNFVSPFESEREFKVFISCNVHKLYAVKYNSTVCSLDYPFQFLILKLLNKIFKVLYLLN